MALRTTADLYTFVDELDRGAAGEVFVSGPEGARGAVFVESGRICWAAALGLAPRLTQLLTARSGISPADMEAIFLHCKTMRAPIGEHLIGIGALAEVDLRAALLQHTVESLRRLCETNARALWSPHPGKGYCSRFTFTTAELCARAGTDRHPALAAVASETLGACFAHAAWAAAFVRTPGQAIPEPIHVCGAVVQSSALLRTGKWAASVLDVIGTFNDREALLAVQKGRTTLLAFREGAAIIVGETDEHGPARILNRRARARRSERSGNADL